MKKVAIKQTLNACYSKCGPWSHSNGLTKFRQNFRPPPSLENHTLDFNKIPRGSTCTFYSLRSTAPTHKTSTTTAGSGRQEQILLVSFITLTADAPRFKKDLRSSTVVWNIISTNKAYLEWIKNTSKRVRRSGPFVKESHPIFFP